MQFATFAFATLLATALPLVPNTQWQLDEAQCSLTFSLAKGSDTVQGSFGSLQAELHFDPESPETGHVVARVRTESVNTGIGMRDAHLRKNDFFGCEAHPEAVFRSERIERTASGYQAVGQLTLKGTTKPLIIPFTFQREGNGVWFTGEFKLDRTDFGIGGNGNLMGKEVALRLRIRATPVGN
jgi:polyisoprenoid-binding protein YceI